MERAFEVEAKVLAQETQACSQSASTSIGSTIMAEEPLHACEIKILKAHSKTLKKIAKDGRKKRKSRKGKGKSSGIAQAVRTTN